MSSLRERLRELLNEQPMTSTELGERLGISYQHVRYYLMQVKAERVGHVRRNKVMAPLYGYNKEKNQ